MKNKEELEKKTSVKHFSVCVMNPPYSDTLHLKFLENCIKYCDTVVNISPGGFIFDIGRYNNLKNKTKNILPHLYEYERLDNRTSNVLFSAFIMGDLHIGIYKHDYTDGKADIDEEQNKIYEKIRYTFKRNLRNNFIRKDKLSKYGLRIYLYHYDATQEAYKNIICFEGKAVNGIDFKSKQEQQNFIDSLKTWPYIFANKLGDVNPAHLPWLEDYSRKYTDDDMYKIFKITDEEKYFIKKFLENDRRSFERECQ